MSKINLTELVMDNLGFLGFNVEFRHKNKEIIKYYLDNNITAIFGNTTFNIDSFKESNSEISIIKFSYDSQKIIRIIYDKMFFDFVKYNDKLVLLDKTTDSKLFKISLKNNIYINMLINIDEPNIIIEIQTCDLDLNEFKYTKIIRCFKEETKFPIFKIKSLLSKNKDVDLFELSYTMDTENINLLERLKYKLNSKQSIIFPTGYKLIDYSYFMKEIFEIMENECNKLENNKTRKK